MDGGLANMGLFDRNEMKTIVNEAKESHLTLVVNRDGKTLEITTNAENEYEN